MKRVLLVLLAASTLVLPLSACGETLPHEEREATIRRTLKSSANGTLTPTEERGGAEAIEWCRREDTCNGEAAKLAEQSEEIRGAR